MGSLLMLALFLLIFVAAPVYHIFFPQSDNGLQLALADAKVTAVSETNRRFSYYLERFSS